VRRWNQQPTRFARLERQKVPADLAGGRLTSDTGGRMLRMVDHPTEANRRPGRRPDRSVCPGPRSCTTRTRYGPGLPSPSP